MTVRPLKCVDCSNKDKAVQKMREFNRCRLNKISRSKVYLVLALYHPREKVEQP